MAGVAGPVGAATIDSFDDIGFDLTSNYLVIDLADSESDSPQLDPDGSDNAPAGSVKQSTYGRVHREADGNNNGSVSAPGGSPSSINKPNNTTDNGQLLPGTTDPSVSTFGGNIAIVDPQVKDVDMTNITIYTEQVGPGYGINCIADCVDSGPQDSELRTPAAEGNPDFGDNNAFDTGIGQSEGALAQGNGVYINQDGDAGEVDLNLVNDEVTTAKDNIAGLVADATLTFSGDKIDNNTNFLLSSVYTIKSGLNVIDIDSRGNDFNITNSNFIIDGFADSDFIFRLIGADNFLVGNARMLVGEDMDLNSTLFYVRDDNDGATINFSNAETNGIAFWNMSMANSREYNCFILASNYRACGQWVSGQTSDWSNFSVDRCAVDGGGGGDDDVPPVPVPASLPLLLAGIVGMGVMARRRRKL